MLNRWTTDRERQIALASTAFDRAIALRPDDPRSYYGRSYVLYLNGHIDEAAQACEQVLTLSPNHARALMRLGFYRLQQGRPAEVAPFVQHSMRLNPLDARQVAWGHFYLGMAEFHLHRDANAYEEMRKATVADPNLGFAWQWMAAIDALHGRDSAAAANLAAFQRIIPGHTVGSLRASEPSKDPDFWAERKRFYEGLRMAGLAD